MKTDQATMTAIETIYARRSVRVYSTIPVERETVLALLDAAVQAPTAIDEEPWVFSVIQDRALLERLSTDAAAVFRQELAAMPNAPHLGDDNLFHDAGTLVVIWAKPIGRFVDADCWLAAENLMLAACAMGLGSCVIGSSIGGLNLKKWKTELGVPLEWSAVAAIILGSSAGAPADEPHKPAQVISWRQAS